MITAHKFSAKFHLCPSKSSPLIHIKCLLTYHFNFSTIGEVRCVCALKQNIKWHFVPFPFIFNFRLFKNQNHGCCFIQLPQRREKNKIKIWWNQRKSMKERMIKRAHSYTHAHLYGEIWHGVEWDSEIWRPKDTHKATNVYWFCRPRKLHLAPKALKMKKKSLMRHYFVCKRSSFHNNRYIQWNRQFQVKCLRI